MAANPSRAIKAPTKGFKKCPPAFISTAVGGCGLYAKMMALLPFMVVGKFPHFGQIAPPLKQTPPDYYKRDHEKHHRG